MFCFQMIERIYTNEYLQLSPEDVSKQICAAKING